MSKSKGFGDDVEKFTKATGIKKLVELVKGGDCSPCQRRKEKLNKIFPYQNQTPPLIPSKDKLQSGKYIFMKNSNININGKNIPYPIGTKILVDENDKNLKIWENLYKIGVIKKTT